MTPHPMTDKMTERIFVTCSTVTGKMYGHLNALKGGEEYTLTSSVQAKLEAAENLAEGIKLLLRCSLPHDVSGRVMVQEARDALSSWHRAKEGK